MRNPFPAWHKGLGVLVQSESKFDRPYNGNSHVEVSPCIDRSSGFCTRCEFLAIVCNPAESKYNGLATPRERGLRSFILLCEPAVGDSQSGNETTLGLAYFRTREEVDIGRRSPG